MCVLAYSYNQQIKYWDICFDHVCWLDYQLGLKRLLIKLEDIYIYEFKFLINWRWKVFYLNYEWIKILETNGCYLLLYYIYICKIIITTIHSQQIQVCRMDGLYNK
jgi:hypothetical protein